MMLLLIVYAAVIPLVPLIGARLYKRRGDNLRRNVCYGITFLQTLLSIWYVCQGCELYF